MNTDKNRAMMIASIFRIKQIQHLFNFPRKVSTFDYDEFHDIIAIFIIHYFPLDLYFVFEMILLQNCYLKKKNQRPCNHSKILVKTVK